MTTKTYPQPGYMILSGWHGVSRHPVEVVGETPKRYRVKLLENMPLPNRKYGKVGDVILAPKDAVKLEEATR